MARIENRTFDELQPGDSVSFTRQLTCKDLEVFTIRHHAWNRTPRVESEARVARAAASLRAGAALVIHVAKRAA